MRYDEFEGGEDHMRWATFVSDHGAEIQLMEPAVDSPLGDVWPSTGKVFTTSASPPTTPARSPGDWLPKGLNTSTEENSDPDMPWQRWTWVMPDSAHGTLVEVARPYRAVDGKWESGSADEPTVAGTPAT